MTYELNTPLTIPSGFNLTIKSGSIVPFAVTASYVIFSGSIPGYNGPYFAINGNTNKIDFSGNNATAIFQGTINALNTTIGGKIFVRNGVYNFPTTVTGINALEIEGESMGTFDNFGNGAVLIYTGSATASFLDFRGNRFVGLKHIKIMNNGSGGGATRGVWVGSTTNDATRAKTLHWENVVIDGFAFGLQGNTFGPDDSIFEHCYIGNASQAAVDHLSSQFTFIGGTIYSSPIGLRVSKDAGGGVAEAGGECYGTVWSGCNTCIDISGSQNINHLTFNSCWFESVSNMILRTTNVVNGIDVGSVYFNNCNGNTDSNTFMDLSNSSIFMIWDNGTLYPTNGTSGSIITNGAFGSKQRIRLNVAAGRNLLFIRDSGNGIRGFDRNVITSINSPYEPVAGKLGYMPGAVGTTYANTAQNLPMPNSQYGIVKATAFYRWNPNSTSGKLRLAYADVGFAESAPAASGSRYDQIDCTAFMRSTTGDLGDLQVQVADNNITGVTLNLIQLVYEY